jgi:hypothetical protein
MVEALSSIVPEGESVLHTPQVGGRPVVFTSPKGESRDVMDLGILSEVEEDSELVGVRLLGLRALKQVVVIERDYNDTYPAVDGRWEILFEATEKLTGWNPQRPMLLQLSLATQHGMCGSGYCSATWSHQKLTSVQEVGPLTHVPTIQMRGQVVINGTVGPHSLKQVFENEIFGWSGDGGCGYYPSGHAWAKVDNTEFWTPTGRGFTKPLIHVFVGGSNTGKSTLGRFVSPTATVYETDKSEEFMEGMAYAQVIVLGEKHPEHTVHGVREFFKKHKLDVELVPVRFSSNVNFDEEA